MKMYAQSKEACKSVRFNNLHQHYQPFPNKDNVSNHHSKYFREHLSNDSDSTNNHNVILEMNNGRIEQRNEQRYILEMNNKVYSSFHRNRNSQYGGKSKSSSKESVYDNHRTYRVQAGLKNMPNKIKVSKLRDYTLSRSLNQDNNSFKNQDNSYKNRDISYKKQDNSYKNQDHSYVSAIEIPANKQKDDGFTKRVQFQTGSSFGENPNLEHNRSQQVLTGKSNQASLRKASLANNFTPPNLSPSGVLNSPKTRKLSTDEYLFTSPDSFMFDDLGNTNNDNIPNRNKSQTDRVTSALSSQNIIDNDVLNTKCYENKVLSSRNILNNDVLNTKCYEEKANIKSADAFSTLQLQIFHQQQIEMKNQHNLMNYGRAIRSDLAVNIVNNTENPRITIVKNINQNINIAEYNTTNKNNRKTKSNNTLDNETGMEDYQEDYGFEYGFNRNVKSLSQIMDKNISTDNQHPVCNDRNIRNTKNVRSITSKVENRESSLGSVGKKCSTLPHKSLIQKAISRFSPQAPRKSSLIVSKIKALKTFRNNRNVEFSYEDFSTIANQNLSVSTISSTTSEDSSTATDSSRSSEIDYRHAYPRPNKTTDSESFETDSDMSYQAVFNSKSETNTINSESTNSYDSPSFSQTNSTEFNDSELTRSSKSDSITSNFFGNMEEKITTNTRHTQLSARNSQESCNSRNYQLSRNENVVASKKTESYYLSRFLKNIEANSPTQLPDQKVIGKSSTLPAGRTFGLVSYFTRTFSRRYSR